MTVIQAVEKKDMDSLRALIESGADVNIPDNAQRTALYYASEKGFTEIVELLIMAGAEG